MDGLDSLRGARTALEEGLISDDDFDSIKVAFLKAQQYRAGLDAGFIEQADYAEVKARFLDDVSRMSITPSAYGPSHSARLPAPGRSPPASPQRTQATPPAEPSPRPSRGSNGAANVPTNIPRMGGALRKNNGPSASMSGITVSEDAVNLYYYMKAKSAYRWAMWKINDAGNEIVITAVGPNESTYANFLEMLPASDCRFAVYDYEVTNSEGRKFNKLVFLGWSPEVSKIRTKMMYASSKDFFKSHLEGLSIELQVSDIDDLSEEDVKASVVSVLTRK